MMEKFSPPFLLLLLAVVGIILSLAGCQSAAAGCGGAASFADMTVVRGVDYLPVAIGSRSAGRAITEADLGPAFDSITVSLGCSPPAQGNYSTRFPVGTKLYALKGYLPSFRLAVKQAQAILLLEAQRNPHATRGGELLDLDKKVHSIIVYKQGTPTAPIATIEDAKQVVVLIALLDEAPIRQGNNAGDTLDILEFHLSDGTFSSLLYDPKTGWTDKNILLPPAFATLLEKAGRSGATTLTLPQMWRTTNLLPR